METGSQFKVSFDMPTEMVRVFPAFNVASREDKLACLDSVEAWIRGTRAVIEAQSVPQSSNGMCTCGRMVGEDHTGRCKLDYWIARMSGKVDVQEGQELRDIVDQMVAESNT